MADAILSGRNLFLTRLAIGLIQGLALYFLYRAQWAPTGRFWPATNGLAYSPLLTCWVFIPPLLSSALGEMRWQRALSWALLAAVVMALLAIYDNWSAWPQDADWEKGRQLLRPHILPSLYLFLFGGAGLFIAHALIVGGHLDGRFQARYPTHFDVAWKLALQIGLSIGFTGAFWLLLWMGAGLFALIKLTFFRELLQKEWVAIPLLSMAAAVALHLTDIRPALVRGARTLVLSLLSWLLPMPALIVTGFLASLPFTGLASLWDTGHATALLLIASAVLLILINAAYQDGEAERAPPRILRLAGTLAACLPVPLSLIAAYALFLRVQQYGWTGDRVMVAACVLVSGAYAMGYARAALLPGPWLKRIESWNFGVALLVLAVLLALFTPLASPARIAVANQMARLQSGKTAPQKFDFAYLRFYGGRYGREALIALSGSGNAVLRDQARATLRDGDRGIIRSGSGRVFAKDVIVHPAGAKLPQSFLDWSKDSKTTLACLGMKNVHCEAALLDLDGDDAPEILVFSEGLPNIQIFRATKGVWRQDAAISYGRQCLALLDALRTGQIKAAPPMQRQWQDIVVNGIAIPLRDLSDPSFTEKCPTPVATPPR